MRKLKFRAWDKKNNRWAIAEVFLDKKQTGSQGIDKNLILTPYRKYCIIMQYTGLKDKNGKEIYEGDIIKFFNNGEIIKDIIFKNGCFGYLTTFEQIIPIGNNFHLDFDKNNQSDKIEVIGNIYENANLLQEKNNE